MRKTKITASSPLSLWQIEGGKVETVICFIFLVSKITANGDCNHEIKRHLLLGRKTMTNLDSILKNRGITLPTKIHLVKAMVFPVVMYGCESWTIKKTELPKNWCFWTLMLEKTLHSPLDSKEIKPVHPKGNQPWIFIGRTDAEAEAPILWTPDAKSNSLEKTLVLGNIEGKRRRGWQDEVVIEHHKLNGHEFEETLGDSEGGVLGAAVHVVAKSRTWTSDWTTIIYPSRSNDLEVSSLEQPLALFVLIFHRALWIASNLP